MKKWLRRASALLAASYVAGLAVAIVLLRFLGEHFWATGVGLYLPRIAFLAPLPIVLSALALFGPRQLLWSGVLAALLVLFPLMGFVLPSPFTHPHAGRPSVRVLSFNIDSLNYGADRVAAAIEAERPDVAVLQELGGRNDAFLERLRRDFGNVRVSTQFVLASRFAIQEVTEPPKIPCYGRFRSPRFVRFVLATPLGSIAVYDIHPISPRWGLYALRGQGLRREILSGRLFRAARSQPLREDTALRVLQARTCSANARGETLPVLIAGDTNLPSLSPAFSDSLGAFDDGFREAGSGFGYTFPSRHPWMRIDRVMASPRLRFTRFEVGCEDTSDHLCVVADVESR